MNCLKQKLLNLKMVEENEFLDKYCNLIESKLNSESIHYETQEHHIVPQSYFRRNDLEVDDSKSNLVNLLFKDHVLAHYYLSLCTIDNYKWDNTNALICMVKQFPESEEELIKDLDRYQELYSYYQSHRREEIHKYKPWLKNKGVSRCSMKEETKRKIGKSNSNKYLGHINIHKGDLDKHIPSEDLDKYLEEGWMVGRSDRIRNLQSMNYNYNNPCMSGKTQSDYQKQRVREANSHPKSEETRKRIGESKKGKVYIYRTGDTHSISVPIEKLNSYLNSRWLKGKLRKDLL
jgi:hypothetical protein